MPFLFQFIARLGKFGPWPRMSFSGKGIKSRVPARIVLFLSLITSVGLTGCGKKGPLYIPTEAQQAQMEKEQAERDAVLEAREKKENAGNDQPENAQTAPPASRSSGASENSVTEPER